MVTFEESAHVPFEIFHLNTFAPVPKDVTVVAGSDGVVITPLPLTSDQSPVPTRAVFAAIVADAQAVCAGPASGIGLTLASILITRLLINGMAPQFTPELCKVIVSFTV